MNILDNFTVAVHHTPGDAQYPDRPPFHPPQAYPEYPFAPGELDRSNTVYDAVRGIFQLLQLDLANLDQDQWNPLGELIQPGDQVQVRVLRVDSVNHKLGLSLKLEDHEPSADSSWEGFAPPEA